MTFFRQVSLVFLILPTAVISEVMPRVCFVGNSITAGVGCDNGTSTFTATVYKLYNYKCQVSIIGHSGATLTDYISLLKTDCANAGNDSNECVFLFKPSIIVIELGTNETKQINWDK